MKVFVLVLSMFFLNNCFEAQAYENHVVPGWTQMTNGFYRFVDKELGVACYLSLRNENISCVKLPGSD